MNQIAWDHLLRGENDANVASVIRVVTRWIATPLVHFAEQNPAEEHPVCATTVAKRDRGVLAKVDPIAKSRAHGHLDLLSAHFEAILRNGSDGFLAPCPMKGKHFFAVLWLALRELLFLRCEPLLKRRIVQDIHLSDYARLPPFLLREQVVPRGCGVVEVRQLGVVDLSVALRAVDIVRLDAEAAGAACAGEWLRRQHGVAFLEVHDVGDHDLPRVVHDVLVEAHGGAGRGEH